MESDTWRSFSSLPQRIFLDSSTLQTLQRYGGFLYENEELARGDALRRNPRGEVNLIALRNIMQVAGRAPFEFALSAASFKEVRDKRDAVYLQWAFDVLEHWEACLEANPLGPADEARAGLVDGTSYGYLGAGDRALLRDAIALECDCFLTFENRLPKNGPHLEHSLGIRVRDPEGMWQLIAPWAALFR